MLDLIMISSLMALAVCMVIFGLWSQRRDEALAKRFDRLAGPVGGIPTLTEIEMREPFSSRIIKPFLHRLAGVLGRMTPASSLEALRRDLILAGRPRNLSTLDFLGLRILSAVGVAAIALPILLLRGLPGPSALLFAVAVGLLGLFLPNFWLKQQIRKRQKRLSRALPDALDMLTIVVDAGLGFDSALMKVSEKWDNELTAEFRRVIQEGRMGVRRSEALRNMVERTQVPEIATFVAIMVQAEKLGVSIADILHTQSEQLRMRRRQQAEAEAQKAPLKMMIPLVLFIFPALFAVILGPAIPRIVEGFAGM